MSSGALTRKLRPNVEKYLSELRNNPEMQPITEPPLRPIKSIQFGILSPEEICAISVCKMKHTRTAGQASETVYDERMGPASLHSNCTTCEEDLFVCPGHFGRCELTVPIIHPLFIKYLVSILNCICLKCSQLKMTKEEIDLELNILEHDRYIRYIDRLHIIVKKCTSIAYCSTCDYPHPEIKEIEGVIHKCYDVIGKKGKKKHCAIEIETLENILSKISNEDLDIMGFHISMRNIIYHGKITKQIPTFRPEWLIIKELPVIPPLSRPPDNEGDNRSDDDLTTSYIDIIKYNERIKDKKLKEKDRNELINVLAKHIKGLFDNSDGTITRNSGKVAKSLSERIKGKYGLLRGKLMGKRVDFSARTVITADITLWLDEVGVPQEIAETLSFPEKVTARNIAQLSQLLDDGKVNTVRRNNQQIRVRFAQQAGRNLKLRVGDYVHRHLRDGDIVVFNRQPSLHRGSMMAHRVRVLPGKTFRLNPSVTTPYNADFDGRRLKTQISNIC
jgi:DNA-directed RNA polymerase II subunit RPB1